MKQGKALITFVMVLLAAALMCYLGYYAWDTLQEPFTTTYAYEYELNDSVEAEGLIELRMNRGAIVKTIDEKYITDHYEMRILLESEAAKRAAQRGMPDAADYIKKLEALQSHMDSVSTEEYEELNLAVHSAIWTAADNERLYKFLSNLWNGPSVGIASPKLDHYIKSTQEHIDILKAIQKQDAKAAQKEMAKHIERSLNNILKNFKFRT